MSTEEDAIEFLTEFLMKRQQYKNVEKDGPFTSVGLRWVTRAKQHLEDKLEASLRGE